MKKLTITILTIFSLVLIFGNFFLNINYTHALSSKKFSNSQLDETLSFYGIHIDCLKKENNSDLESAKKKQILDEAMFCGIPKEIVDTIY